MPRIDTEAECYYLGEEIMTAEAAAPSCARARDDIEEDRVLNVLAAYGAKSAMV